LQGGRSGPGRRLADQPQVLLAVEDAERLWIEIGRDDHLDEQLADFPGGRPVHGAIEGDDGAVGRVGIGFKRPAERVGAGIAQRDAARVGVLDDGAGACREFHHQLPGGVHVLVIVIGELFAVQLLRSQPAAGRLPADSVNGRALVRILTVAQRALPMQHVADDRGRPSGGCGVPDSAVRGDEGIQILADACVVHGRGFKRLPCQSQAGIQGETACLVELPDHPGVIVRVHHHGHVGKILRGRPDEGDTADVDFFQRLGHRDAAGNPFRKRIQIHHHKINRRNAALAEAVHVGRTVAAGQNPRVHRRMQGLHPAVQQLGETGHVRHFAHVQTASSEQASGAAGGNDGGPMTRQRGSQFREAAFVVDAEEGGPDTDHGELLSPRGSFLG